MPAEPNTIKSRAVRAGMHEIGQLPPMPKTRFSESHWIEAVAGHSAGDWRSIAVSFGAALVTLVVATLAVNLGAPAEPAAPVAVVRQTAGGGDWEIAAAQLLTVEQLSRALRESQFPAAQGIADMALAEVAERVRSNLRVDLAPGGRGAPPTATIRWIGDRGTPGAAALMNWLAHHFVDIRQTDRIAAAEQTHRAAAAKLREATEDVRAADQSFQRALADAGRSEGRDLPATPPTIEEPSLESAAATPAGARPARRAQLQSQLAELEAQRSALAERLMPAHPEMKALDTQIASLRAKLADTAALETPGDVALPPPPAGEASKDAAPHWAGLHRQWQAVATARRQHETALAAERAAWEWLTRSKSGEPVEIVPASPAPSAAPEAGWWKSAATGLAAWLAGWLVLVCWPSPTAPLTTAEQVRRATRLPVIAVPSLN